MHLIVNSSTLMDGNLHHRITARFGALMAYLNCGQLPVGHTPERALDEMIASFDDTQRKRIETALIAGGDSVGVVFVAAQACGIQVSVPGPSEDGGRKGSEVRYQRLSLVLRHLASKMAAAQSTAAQELMAKADLLNQVATSLLPHGGVGSVAS